MAIVCQQKTDKENLVFYGALTTPLTAGQCLIIGGIAMPDAHCIRINLFSRLGVVNLCLIISFDEKLIKRCAFVHGKWTEEQIEKNLLAHSPWKSIRSDELFTVNIVTGGGKFFIAINETPFCVFPHVIHQEKVQAVRIFGDLKTVRSFNHRQVFPKSIPKFEVNHPLDVFRNQVAKRFSPGSLIILRATPTGNRKGHFIIYIMDDSKLESCALYFEARFYKQTVVVDCRNPQFSNHIDHVLIDHRHYSSLMNVRMYRRANMDSDHYLVAWPKMMTQFVGNLACPIEFGNSIVIAGKTIDGAQRTQINLRANKEDISNIGLHLSIRFDEEIIIRNTLINNEWGEEERSDHLNESTSPNPLVPGDFFIVNIFAGEKKFHISINHRPYCTFKYRTPIEQLVTVEVKDHLQAVTQIDHRTAFPSPWPPIQCSNPRKVFSNDCPILFTPGHVIVITALPHYDENGQFFILFMDGDSQRELLHFNARFHPYNVVVRNAMKENLEFGPEERDGGFPFRFNQQFRLAIAIAKNSFIFAVDGRRFCSFAFRKSHQLDTMTGFKIKTTNGMHMQVTSVDHLDTHDMDCADFEKYSNPRYVIM